MLRSHSHSDIAVLNTRDFDRLKALQKTYSLNLEGCLEVSKSMRPGGAANQSNESRVKSINVNLYGPPDVSENVAMELSRQDLFLQEPEVIAEGYTYDNPQYLQLPTFEDSMQELDEQQVRQVMQYHVLYCAQDAHGAPSHGYLLTEPCIHHRYCHRSRRSSCFTQLTNATFL